MYKLDFFSYIDMFQSPRQLIMCNVYYYLFADEC